MTEVDVNKISEILKAVNAGEKRLDSPKIRDEFRDLLDDLSDTSNSELELSIKEDGVRDPHLQGYRSIAAGASGTVRDDRR